MWPKEVLLPIDSDIAALGEVNCNDMPSEWVSKKMKIFYEFLGLSFAGFEEDIVSLFSTIDQRRRTKGSQTTSKRGSYSGGRGQRELKKLQWSLNYEGKQNCKKLVVGRRLEELFLA